MDTYSFYIIVILAAVIYELGFARKLPPLKKIVIYIFLFIGCIPLTVLKVLGLPMIQAMIVTAVLLFIARIRRSSNTNET